MLKRAEWLKEKRRMTEIRYDTMFARDYDEHWSHINPSHRAFLLDFLAYLPSDGMILDAACGTGKYWPIILESQEYKQCEQCESGKQHQYKLMGIDQSQQMLLQALVKFPTVIIEKLGLQEIRYADAFDGIICIDAMEMVFPEDWLLILHNFQQALHFGGYCYFTVEVIDPGELIESQAEAKRLGLPTVAGEYAHAGGYHYYPRLDQVRTWLRETYFHIVKEGEGDGYHHFIARRV